jgi:hypothetical protein
MNRQSLDMAVLRSNAPQGRVFLTTDQKLREAALLSAKSLPLGVTSVWPSIYRDWNARAKEHRKSPASIPMSNSRIMAAVCMFFFGMLA